MDNNERRDTQPLAGGSWLERLSSRRGITILAGASLTLLIVAVLGGWYIIRQGLLPGINGLPDISPPESLGDLAAKYPQLSALLNNPELDSVYKGFIVAYKQGGPEAALDLARLTGVINSRDEVRITLELDTTDTDFLAGQLEAKGIIVTAVSGNLMDIAIPLAVVEEIMRLDNLTDLFTEITEFEHVTRVRLPRSYTPDSGSVGEESLPVIGADVWHSAGYSGQGIKIGILDLGFNGYRGLLGTELPQNVTTRSFIAGLDIDESNTEHGTAVAEVVHDIAPQAELVFAAYETDVELQQAVDWLMSQGVQIIQHSAGTEYGPMDGSTLEAQMVNRVTDSGVLWINSAGNSGESHYRATFTDEDGDGFHEFSQGDELLELYTYGYVVLVLNWDDWGNGSEDYNLYVLDENLDTVVSSENIQAGGGSDSAEIIGYNFGESDRYAVAFYAERTTRPAVFDFYARNAEIEYYSPSYSIVSPADARGSFTVGATYWRDDVLEPYSSQGPTNDGRLKPDISAPTGVDSAVYGGPFYGTSASAPHVTGAAALVWDAYPDYSVGDIITFLEGRALDFGTTGPDYSFGYGRLWLGEIPTVEILPTATHPAIVPTSTPAITLVPTSTSAPSRRATSTPTPGRVEQAGLGIWPLVALACVGAFGFLGLGGIGMLAVVIRRRRQQPSLTPGPPTSHRCPRCGAYHRYQARFCPSCGYPLGQKMRDKPKPARCAYCGDQLRTSSKFCPRCGMRQ